MNVDDVVAEKIAAARARIEATKRRRAALAAARQRGLALRHAAKLRNLRGAEGHADVGQPSTTAGQSPKVQANRGDITTVAVDSLSTANDTEENQ
ncbi:hypothetical protein H9W91_17540 [Streptomyces alfalfae]|uniref:hypothetical protein n=1 Tax=Streptomyces alfalfae TaxID=1642299 RepID=UPI001BAD7C2E|nr:hypothetical protein [Streptomyces alfalfae]QUI36291.1 hypothetical protein H9W91_17540 [Streptomyces alfalfae]